MSAYHGARFLLSAAAASQFPTDQGAEVAIAGRSNSGKSSVLNAVTGRRALARTSKTPGRTRLLNFFELTLAARLIDLPGYGYAAGPPTDRVQWAALIEALAQRRSLRGLLLVVDGRRGVAQADQQLLDWASALALPVHVLLSKADQLPRAAAHAALTAAQQQLLQRASVQLFSAHAGTGLEELRARLDAWFAPLNGG